MKAHANKLAAGGRIAAQAIGVGLIYLGIITALAYPVVGAAGGWA